MSASRKAAPPATTHTITELALEFDITPRAIRFYEDVGLLTPGREGRNRVYTHRDRTRLKLTLRGKRLGVGAGDSPQATMIPLQQLAEHREVLGRVVDEQHHRTLGRVVEGRCGRVRHRR